jgi:hypothetical protein
MIQQTTRITNAIAALTLSLAGGTALAAAPVNTTTNSSVAAYPTGADTFAIGTDGHIRELKYASGAWTAFDLSGSLNAMPAVYGSTMSSVVGINSPYALFYLSADGQVQKLARNTSTQAWTYTDVTAHASVAAGTSGIVQPAVRGSGLAAIGLSGSHYRVYYVDPNGHVQEFADTSNGNWVMTDLTQATGTAGAALASGVTAIDHKEPESSYCIPPGATCGPAGAPAAPSSNIEFPRVYYFSTNGHVQEMAWGSDGIWHATDITAASHTSATAVGGLAIGSFDYLGPSKYALDGRSIEQWFPRVYYFDTANHVQEMAWGGGWNATDISAASGAPTAMPGSAMVAFPWAQQGGTDPKVYYFSSEGHVRELQWWGGWRVSDITALTCAAPAVAGSRMDGFYWMNDYTNTYPSGVAYLSADGHVRQLLQTTSWKAQDINGSVGTPTDCSSSGGSGGSGGGGGGGGGWGGTTHPAQ